MKRQSFYMTHAPLESSVSPADSLALFENSLRTYKNSPQLENPKTSEQFLKAVEKQLQNRQEKVNKNKKRHSNLKEKFEIIEELLKNAANQLKIQREQECLMEKSSLKIQKVFRGFITRKKLESVTNI